MNHPFDDQSPLEQCGLPDGLVQRAHDLGVASAGALAELLISDLDAAAKNLGMDDGAAWDLLVALLAGFPTATRNRLLGASPPHGATSMFVDIDLCDPRLQYAVGNEDFAARVQRTLQEADITVHSEFERRTCHRGHDHVVLRVVALNAADIGKILMAYSFTVMSIALPSMGATYEIHGEDEPLESLDQARYNEKLLPIVRDLFTYDPEFVWRSAAPTQPKNAFWQRFWCSSMVPIAWAEDQTRTQEILLRLVSDSERLKLAAEHTDRFGQSDPVFLRAFTGEIVRRLQSHPRDWQARDAAGIVVQHALQLDRQIATDVMDCLLALPVTPWVAYESVKAHWATSWDDVRDETMRLFNDPRFTVRFLSDMEALWSHDPDLVSSLVERVVTARSADWNRALSRARDVLKVRAPDLAQIIDGVLSGPEVGL